MRPATLRLALLVLPSSPAQATKLEGTWYVLIHYRDSAPAHASAWRWDDRVWSFSRERGELTWRRWSSVPPDADRAQGAPGLSLRRRRPPDRARLGAASRGERPADFLQLGVARGEDEPDPFHDHARAAECHVPPVGGVGARSQLRRAPRTDVSPRPGRDGSRAPALLSVVDGTELDPADDVELAMALTRANEVIGIFATLHAASRHLPGNPAETFRSMVAPGTAPPRFLPVVRAARRAEARCRES